MKDDKLPPRYADIIAMLTKRTDPETVELVRDALADAERIHKIRELFQSGRDVEAVAAIRDLSPVDLYKLLPMSSESAGAIKPAQSAQITATVQIPFRPTRLLVGRQGAEFLIEDIKTNNLSHTVQAGSIPAELFAGNFAELEQALTGQLEDGLFTIRAKRSVLPLLGLPVSMPELRVGDKVIMVVTNVSKEARDFTGAFLGLTPYH